jgi:LuxR family maltose regulon positive regulatory protein
MHADLLTVKLYVPPPRPTLVLRPRLTAALSKALAHSLTLVSAPAGYGKTTLVSAWLRETDVPSAWLSLDESDNDPARFLQYFTATLQPIVPAIQADRPAMLQAMEPVPFDAQMGSLINEIAAHAAPFVLVLDDFHLVHAQPVLDMLTFLLEHMPPPMHVVLVTRTDPPLPLARLRACAQLVDIRADQLRFTPDEIAVFLNQMIGLSLSAGDIAALEARTEGWVAGLQLAALSMQGCPDIHSFLAAFTGSHAYIMDYLTAEVLDCQPEGVRSFLLQTSILGRMCGPLCEAVVEADRTGPLDGQATLEALEQKNLFVIPLDGERRWYRYHHLFADVLARRLEHMYPQHLTGLHRRASQWYEQNGLVLDAIRHALLAGDQDRAVQLVEGNGCILLMAGEVTTLLQWVEAVESYAQTHPWLSVLKAWALALTGHLEPVEPLLEAAERLIAPLEPTPPVKIMLGAMATARAYRVNIQGNTRPAVDFARQALDCLPDDDPLSRSLRSVATSILGDASWMNGDLAGAEHAYREAARIGQAAGTVHMAIIANSHLAEVLMEQGWLYQAARTYSETLPMATRPDGQRSPLADRIYAGLSMVSYEQNDLEASMQCARQCLDLCRQWGSYDFRAISTVMMARLEHSQGYLDKAQAAMRAAEQLVSQRPLSPRWTVWVKSVLARLWLAQGNVEQPAHFVQQGGLTPDDEIPYLRELEYLTLLRLLLAQGDLDAALALSGRLLQKAEAAHRMGRVIEVLVLQALAFQAKRDMPRALAILDKAVSLAQPEGYVRTFLDEGEPMARLLYQAQTRHGGTGYASGLLAALAAQDRASAPAQLPAQLLIEPLSARELEVLKLIEAGHSNQEIAARLVISMPTVKRHISNIYAKLGAKSRTQAVSLGRELRLFE